ncbi:hypothetical protein [Pedobacter terrae]|nr:hypothetical protein [Pedobacter terrae]
MARWQEAFTLQRNGHSTADSAALLMKRFPGLSRATAYRDCANALSLFGDIAQSTKQGIKHLATEIVKDAIGIARIKNNEVAMIQGAKEMASINGVNTVDPDLPDFSKLEPNTYNISLPQNVISALQSMITGGHINLGGLVNEMSKHADEAEIIKDDESD